MPPAKGTATTPQKPETPDAVRYVVTEQPRARVSVEIERMSKGPAKATVRIDGDDADDCAGEALRIYNYLLEQIAQIEESFDDTPKPTRPKVVRHNHPGGVDDNCAVCVDPDFNPDLTG